jgi:fido (protein-threonine AMPylation protein)
MAEDTKKSKTANRTITVDLAELYKFNPEDLVTDIKESAYSNLAFIQVTHRDVFIDFFEMPGMKRDGKMVMPGTRIYMSFAAAQRLSEALTAVLEKCHRDGEMEQYVPGSPKAQLSTKVQQKRQSKIT